MSEIYGEHTTVKALYNESWFLEVTIRYNEKFVNKIFILLYFLKFGTTHVIRNNRKFVIQKFVIENFNCIHKISGTQYIIVCMWYMTDIVLSDICVIYARYLWYTSPIFCINNTDIGYPISVKILNVIHISHKYRISIRYPICTRYSQF